LYWRVANGLESKVERGRFVFGLPSLFAQRHKRARREDVDAVHCLSPIKINSAIKHKIYVVYNSSITTLRHFIPAPVQIKASA
jgi:hypothetical protein